MCLPCPSPSRSAYSIAQPVTVLDGSAVIRFVAQQLSAPVQKHEWHGQGRMTTEESLDQNRLLHKTSSRCKCSPHWRCKRRLPDSGPEIDGGYMRNWPFPIKLGLAAILICFIPCVCLLMITGSIRRRPGQR